MIDNLKVWQLLSTNRWNDQHWRHLHWLPGNWSTWVGQSTTEMAWTFTWSVLATCLCSSTYLPTYFSWIFPQASAEHYPSLWQVRWLIQSLTGAIFYLEFWKMTKNLIEALIPGPSGGGALRSDGLGARLCARPAEHHLWALCLGFRQCGDFRGRDGASVEDQPGHHRHLARPALEHWCQRWGETSWNFQQSFLSDQDQSQERYRQEGVQGPENGWNYPDGLFVGKVTIIMMIKILTIIFIMVTVFAQGGMTDIEYKSMFALWCLVKAPLMLGADLRTITRYDDNEMTIWQYDDSSKMTISKVFFLNRQGEWGLQNHHQSWPFGSKPRSPWGTGKRIWFLILKDDQSNRLQSWHLPQGQCVKDCCSHGSTGGEHIKLALKKSDKI